MRAYVFAALVLAATASAAEPALPKSTPAPAEPPVSRNVVEHDGQTFELANRASSNNLETDEFVVAGETLGNWTQLVTVQRLTLPKPMSTQEFVTYFQKRLQDENGASLEVLKQAKSASVFVVRFPQSDRNDEQVMICLAFAEAAHPVLLNVVQYAIKPTRVSVDLVEARIKSWRNKFVRQAEAMAGSPTS